MTRLQFELVPRVCVVEQLVVLDVSALGFPLPFFGGLGVLRCLDDLNSLGVSTRPVAQLVHVCARTPPACRVLTYIPDSRQLGDPYPGIGHDS